MKKLLEKYRIELKEELKNILSYWSENTVDIVSGGFYGKIDHFNRIDKHASKGVVLNARILWTFSAAYNYQKDKECLIIADRAFEYLKEKFYDKENGGLFWEVDYLGKPVNKRKQIYAQGFGIYGFSEYYKATGIEESLELAKELFNAIETYSFDQENGGYLEALSQDWGKLEDMRLSEKDGNYPKSMNTHLHILEPYTNLYRVWKNDALASKIRKLVRTFLDHIINHQTGHFNLFFEEKWQVRSKIVSYGHDIEGAWLLTEAAEELGDVALLKEVQETAIQMTDATAKEGLDVDGGLKYEYDAENDHVDTDRHWWPQAEAMIGFVNAYQISGDEKYLQKSMKSWEFVKQFMLDKSNGEWYWRVDSTGKAIESEEKAGFWKCPYHNSRACLEIVHRIDKLMAKK